MASNQFPRAGWKSSSKLVISAGLVISTLSATLSGCAKFDADELFADAVVDAASAHWDEALVTLRKALRADPSHLSSLVLKGLCLHHMQQADEAVTTLREAAQAGPNDFAAQYFYGWILCESREYENALRPLRKAHELRPEHPETLALLSRCCLEQSLPEGIEHLNALRSNPTYGRGPAVFNGIAILHLSNGDRVQAKNFLMAALRREPTNPVPAQNLAVLYDQYLSEPDKAVRYYGIALVNSQKAGDQRRAAAVRERMLALAQERRSRGN